MKRTGFAVLLLLLCPLWNTPGKAAKNPQQLYAGIMVGWDQVEKPNRPAGALGGATLGATSTSPAPAEPSGAGDGVSRAAQGTIAEQRAQDRMRYPGRWFTVYSFHSGYYVVSASMRSSKKPLVRTGDTVRFRIKNRTPPLTDGLGKTFKLEIVGTQRTSIPYVPAAGTGKAFSPNIL